MGKKKKRLQMQKPRSIQVKAMQKILADGVGLGLLDQVGFDKRGEPIYTMKPDFEQRLEMLKKSIGYDEQEWIE